MSKSGFLVIADQTGNSDLGLSSLLILVIVFTFKVSEEESSFSLVYSRENVFAAVIAYTDHCLRRSADRRNKRITSHRRAASPAALRAWPLRRELRQELHSGHSGDAPETDG